MEKNWVKVYTHTDFLKTEIIKSALESHEMAVIAINKRDSSYQNFGEIELYVHQDHFKHAIEIIIQNEI